LCPDSSDTEKKTFPFDIHHYLIPSPHKLNIRIPDTVLQKYRSSHQEKLNALCDALKDETGIVEALKGYHGAGSSSNSSGVVVATGEANREGDNTNRTVGMPDWQGEPPINIAKRLNLTQVPIADFRSTNRFLDPRTKSLKMFFLLIYPM